MILSWWWWHDVHTCICVCVVSVVPKSYHKINNCVGSGVLRMRCACSGIHNLRPGGSRAGYMSTPALAKCRDVSWIYHTWGAYENIVKHTRSPTHMHSTNIHRDSVRNRRKNICMNIILELYFQFTLIV